MQNAIITQELIDSRRLVNTLAFRVNMSESSASGELIISMIWSMDSAAILAGEKPEIIIDVVPAS